jgi:hypothetical protein
MRLQGVCNGNAETTVFAHHNGGGGGTKDDDHCGADMCSSCHDVYDGRVRSTLDPDFIERKFDLARMRTIINRLERKVVK